MKKNVLKSTILLSATVLSIATVSVFADDELVPTTEATEVVDNGGNATENLATDIIKPSHQMIFQKVNPKKLRRYHQSKRLIIHQLQWNQAKQRKRQYQTHQMSQKKLKSPFPNMKKMSQTLITFQ